MKVLRCRSGTTTTRTSGTLQAVQHERPALLHVQAVAELPSVRFFALDSNYIDPKQVEWLAKDLAASGSDWKVAFFHHPPCASGHGTAPMTIIRAQLEPLFLR